MRTRRKAPFVVIATAVMLAVVPLSMDSATASTQGATVDGQYKITSTDCYFGGGACTTIFDIEQIGYRLHVPHDKYFHGQIHARRVHIAETFGLGTIEDSWGASGTTTDGGLTIRGTMWDGIGGSGTFVMKYTGP
jgi:hypothetical protein